MVATCALGTEAALAQELRDLRAYRIRQGRGLVRFHASLPSAMALCMKLRTAMRVLMPLGAFPARNADELYAGAKALPWRDHMTPRHTFRVDATGGNEELRHTGFIGLKVKDAIADALRETLGVRPNVELHRPDVPVVVHVDKNEAQVSLDLCGESLHRRGYRPEDVQAPLKETLAAALLILSGYNGTRAFCDPLAGSGTLVVEAAWMAMNRAPNLHRHFAFERWPNFAGTLQSAWHRTLHEAREAVRTTGLPPILAGDWSDKVLLQMEKSIDLAGLKDVVRMERWDARRAELPQKDGVIVTNPPYAERLGQDLQVTGLYRGLGESAERWSTWDMHVFCGHPHFLEHFGHTASSFVRLFNGPSPTVLYAFPVPRTRAPARTRR
jgi:23S rRNA (guanine2445-N2)-methyltransferase / 23S rRNA (guanine2069-N7)-methyltransferase